MGNLIGVIGGSGLYSLFEEDNIQYKEIETPFGKPSDHLAFGKISGKDVVFIPRHSRNHSILPTEVNYLANIYAMKMVGVDRIISISAVGSLQKEYKPRDVVIVDQFFDRTNKRPQTFFGDGVVGHVSFGDPVCPELRKSFIETIKTIDITAHEKGTYVNMEGPQFSTRAESLFYQRQGFDVIGMTNLSEARLAREAEICYGSLAFVTDYDCWHEEEEDVTTDSVLKVLRDNADKAKEIVRKVINAMKNNESPCSCHSSLANALITRGDAIPEDTGKRLYHILKPYL